MLSKAVVQGRARPVIEKMRAALVWVLILPLRGYQRFISPMLAPRCRYYPSCSTYAIDSLRIHGPVKGPLLGTWRVLRCNPWSKGGVDHVPDKGKWKPAAWVPPDDWPGHDIEENQGATPLFTLRRKRVDD